MSSIAELFHLKRDTLVPDPFTDASSLFIGRRQIEGRDKLLNALQRRVLQKRPPIALVQGQYGSGKTHLLLNIIACLSGSKALPLRIHAPYVKAPDLPSNATFLDFFPQVMTQIGRSFVIEALTSGVRSAVGKGAHAVDVMHGEEDLSKVAEHVTLKGDTLPAWRWLSGMKISASERSALDVRSHIDNTETCINVLFSIGEMAIEHVRTMIVLLFDEIEFLKGLRPDSMKTFENAFRLLMGRTNTSVGVLIAVQSATRDDLPPFLRSDAVWSRIQEQNVVSLAPFEPNEALDFIKGLLAASRSEEDIPGVVASLRSKGVQTSEEWYPLTEKAARAIVAKAGASPPITTRDLCEKVSDAIAQAALMGKEIVDPGVVESL